MKRSHCWSGNSRFGKPSDFPSSTCCNAGQLRWTWKVGTEMYCL